MTLAMCVWHVHTCAKQFCRIVHLVINDGGLVVLSWAIVCGGIDWPRHDVAFRTQRETLCVLFADLCQEPNFFPPAACSNPSGGLCKA